MIKVAATFKLVIRYCINLTTHKLLMRMMLAIHFTKLSLRRHSLKRKAPGRKIIAIDLIEHFGDIVACEPVSRYVREKFPDAYIIWSVRKPYRELIDNNPNIDETLVVYCLTEWIRLPKEKLFDETIEMHMNGRVCPFCKIPLQHLHGDRDITLDNYYNFGGILSTFCRSAGLPVLADQPKVYISQHAFNAINSLNLPEKYIVVHCASNETDRDWEISKWQDLIGRLIVTLDINIVEVGSERSLKGIRSDHFINLCGKLTLLETAEVIRRSQLFIGVDSGPAQLANAVMTYGIILLGHYRAFKKYLPYSGGYGRGTHATILYEDGPASNIGVDRVYQETVKRIEPSKTIQNNR